MIVIFLIISLIFSFSSAENDNSGHEKLRGKLVFTHILYRHGDRMPAWESYPLDPWKDERLWPNKFGQLSDIGKNQQYELGKWLNKRYFSIINSKYSPTNIYVQSTDVDHTIMSAQANLAGLFRPLKEQEKITKDILWQLIPIHTIPKKLDSVLAAEKPCPALDVEMTELRNSSEFKKNDQRFSYLYKYLTKHTGMKVNNIGGIFEIYEILSIETLYNKTLPPWTQKVFPSKDMTYATNLSFLQFTYNRKLARLKSGPLLKEILNRFTEKSEQKLQPNRALWMYSAHDVTIANLLNTLKLFQMHIPPYTATVLLEMRISGNITLISIFYKNTTSDPEPLNIPNCGIQCPLSKMYELYSDVIPDDWDSECEIKSTNAAYLISDDKKVVSASVNTSEIIVIFAVLLIVGALVYVGVSNYRRQKEYSGVAVDA